jgi:hypothetical protein
MRFAMTWVACISITLCATGCNTEGVGTKLYPADVATQTAMQNAYVVEICQQSGLQPTVFDGVTSCGPNPFDPKAWWLFVQAGMNDIDQRCDAYLAWLDEAQRSREPVLNELALASTTAQTIMQSAGTGVNPIVIVGAAFGLASGTFTNVYSRLIINMPHSTVQAVVLSRQKGYRDQLIGTSTTRPVVIVSKPAALYALRSYLRLCMPMTIETEINNTIATFERNGADGLEKDSLISAQSAGAPFTPASVVQKPVRAPVTPPPDDIAPFFAEKNLSAEDEGFTLGALCIGNNTTTGLPRKDLIKALIAIYEAVPPDSENPSKRDGIISRSERLVIDKQPDCNGARNYFEKSTYANTVQPDNNGANLAESIGLLNRSSAGGPLTGTPALDDLRKKMSAVRMSLPPMDVPPLPSALSNQATFALITALKKLPKSN